MADVSDGGFVHGRGIGLGRPAAPAGPLAAAPVRLEHISLAARHGLGSFAEIDCIRHRLPPGVIAAAEARAAALGIGADEVLIAARELSEERYFRSLAFSLGLTFAELDTVPRDLCPLSDECLMLAARAGMLPLVLDDEIVWVIARPGAGARHLISLVRQNPELRRYILITSPIHIRRFVERHGVTILARNAAEWLCSTHPLYSAATRTWRMPAVVGGGLTLLAAGCVLAPTLTITLLQAAISIVFLAWTGMRIVAAVRAPRPAPAAAALADSALPVFTVVLALYREAAALPGLIEALHALDYPREKLDVKLVLEADDPKTYFAAKLFASGPPFEIIFAPASGPRTKPKALNTALPFARGDFLVIYDAEDRPESDQLRRAVEAFRADNSGNLACVQARLTIDNTADGWLPALFTAEYAGLFDVLLPGLAARGLPIPLGGSSNHFRTSVLRQAGGWDPYNVTEDADLGTRLARLGYRVDVIASSTYEEAPVALDIWLKQRTRWFKGWIQTWCVHMREPRRLWRELGTGGFVTFQLMLVGTVLAALLQPVALALLVGSLAGVAAPFATTEGFPGTALTYLHWGALASGYVMSIVLACAGLVRRRLLSMLWQLPLMIPYWLLLSVAAWRAVFHLARSPYLWEKTEHGLARTSRRAAKRSSLRSRPGYRGQSSGALHLSDDPRHLR
ncbi:MAG TPA: glycosyltransferase family 2 protein [Xanthobacteraceae bacterium]|nr:glycosyltransferase family 2 protein [Xanthobacteraceae bacterium]